MVLPTTHNNRDAHILRGLESFHIDCNHFGNGAIKKGPHAA